MRIRVRTNPDAYMKKRVAQPKDFLRVSPGLSRAFPAFSYPAPGGLRPARSGRRSRRCLTRGRCLQPRHLVIAVSPTKQHGEDRQGEDERHLESDDQHVKPWAIDTSMRLPPLVSSESRVFACHSFIPRTPADNHLGSNHLVTVRSDSEANMKEGESYLGRAMSDQPSGAGTTLVPVSGTGVNPLISRVQAGGAVLERMTSSAGTTTCRSTGSPSASERRSSTLRRPTSLKSWRIVVRGGRK